MAHISSRILRAVGLRPFMFLILVGVLAFVPALLDASVEAVVKTENAQRERNPEPSESDHLMIEDELRSIEMEFDNYLAQIAVASPASEGLLQSINQIASQLLVRLAAAKEQLQRSDSRDRAYDRNAQKRIALLDKRIVKHQTLFGQRTANDPTGRGIGSLKSGKLAPAATGAISGTITNASGGAPIQNVLVQIFNSTGNFVASVSTNASGVYTSPATLATGNYFARTFNTLGFIDELYNNIVCLSCNATTGTAISVTDGSTTPNIDFALAAGGRISGTVTDSATAAPIANINVFIFNSSGAFQTSTISDASGNYLSNGLPSGSYFASTSNSLGYVNELYNNIPCVGCAVTSGTPISVTSPSTTSGINFALAIGGTISGNVTDAGTSAPIAGVGVRIFDNSGIQVNFINTNLSGAYATSIALPAGAYFVRTINSMGYLDELYDNIPCATGCNVTTGIPVFITAGLITPGINFALNTGGRISGTITDASTSAPIDAVDVDIFDSSGVFVTTASTDASGNYQTDSVLNTGTYYAITFNGSSYLDELYNNIRCPGCDVTTGTPISVTAGATTSAINFALTLGGRIAGTITDAATSNPISGVNVQIFSSNGLFAAQAVTNATGNYVITTGLTTGTYFARTVNSQGYVNELYDNITCLTCNPATGTPISVTEGAITSGINFALALGGKISGTVTNALNAAPLQNVNLRIYNSLGVQVAAANSNASGIYTVTTGLTTGTYYVRAFSGQGFISQSYMSINCTTCTPTLGTPITVTAPATTTGINFALNAGGRISGIITDSSTAMPVPGIAVQILAPDGAIITTVGTNGAGAYTTTQGLPTGTYFARTANDLSYKDQIYANITCVPCEGTSGIPISVTAPSITTGINFNIEPGGSISGTITDAVTSAPLIDVEVSIFDFDGNFITFGVTDAQGKYTSFAGLTSGVYYAATFNQSGYIDELYDNITCAFCDVLTGTPINVNSGMNSSGIDFALSAGGRVSGMITDSATTAPIGGITTQIFDSDGAFVAFGVTNATGSYTTTTGLPTGTYYARAANNIGYVTELYNNITCLSCDVTTGTPISITAGATTSGINFSLDAGGRIFGALNDISDLTSIPAARVEVYNSSGTLVSTSTSNTLGNYTSAALPAGTYYARTTNTRGFVDKLYNDIQCIGCTVTTGTAITVSGGSVTSEINFALCSYTLSPKNSLFNSRGGEGSVSVAASGTCGWTATSNDAWIDITSIASDTGNGVFNFLVRENVGPDARTGTITVGSSTFTIFQAGNGSCSLILSPAFWRFGAPGGQAFVQVTAGAGCAWQVASNANWLVITSPTRGTGSATLNFVVLQNTTGGPRDGVITSAGKKISVKQK
jgi:hypothetical protein